MLLWSNVLSDTVQVDMYQYLKKLRPTDSAGELMALQEKLIPALLETIIDDMNTHLPDGLVAFQTKVDRQSKKRVSASAVEISSFGEWTEPFRQAPVGTSEHIYLADDGDIVGYDIDADFIKTSYLRFLPKGDDPAEVQRLNQQVMTSSDDASFVRIVESATLPIGYLFAYMYNIHMPGVKQPEGAPMLPMRKRPLPLNRMLTGHTPANIKAILSKF